MQASMYDNVINSKCNMNRKKYLTLFSIISVLLGAFSSLNAQQVVGTIIDSDGEPIPYEIVEKAHELT